MLKSLVVLIVLAISVGVPSAQENGELRLRGFDQILDTYVRDGYVYYRALKLERQRFDAYVSSLAATPIDKASRNEQVAFWINAYNAFVLQTVIDHYPIHARTSEYPAHSIRQIPGAFERLTHRAAGRTVTLDQIEQTILAGFDDPRVFFALGRGSVGGGRLRSEAYSADQLEAQLAGVADECTSRASCFHLDPTTDRVLVSPIFSWREKAFTAHYSGTAPAAFTDRSPVERAAIAFAWPKLLTTERDFLEKNTFKVVFQPFDWTLNDLTGRGGR
jgi:hypothetical protein